MKALGNFRLQLWKDGRKNILTTGILVCLLVWISLGWVPVAMAAGTSSPHLTVDLLRQRIAHPVERDGSLMVNLRDMVIDLREDSDLQAPFYRLLQNALQSGQSPPGLDLSHASIWGNLDLQQLGLRAPLYGDSLLPLLGETAQAQLKQDRQRLTQLSQLSRSLLIQEQSSAQQVYVFRGALLLIQTHVTGQVRGTDTFFLAPVLAQGAQFDQGLYLPSTRFNQRVNFAGAGFGQDVRLRNSIFFGQVRFDQGVFRGTVNFQGAEFRDEANFNQSHFEAESNFSRVQWQGNADFAQTNWQGTASFLKASFGKALFLTEARFDAPLVLRQARFSEAINLRNSLVGTQVDFGDATFEKPVYINVSGMEFNPEQAEILGTPGAIGRRLSVPILLGNETLLRNLARNFRKLEQIADADQVEYTAARLRLQDWTRQLSGVNINTASLAKLRQVGFSTTQAQTILQRRQEQVFLSATDLLSLDGIDLAVYVRVRDRILTSQSRSWLGKGQLVLRWVLLSLIILLSHYGTSVGLTFGIGILSTALFALLFWFVDRYRRRVPHPLFPSVQETVWMLGGFGGLILLGLTLVWRIADHLIPMLMCWAGLTLPIPLLLLFWLLKQGRYHDLMTVSYFVEDGSMRQLRLLIARLPIIPKFPFYRDRYTPLLIDRRWNWLNYFDFSLNNWLKFGFNDIRLRDQHVPGLITALVWYQWGLGLLYVALLLWTLSRTIPGLNLLLYF